MIKLSVFDDDIGGERADFTITLPADSKPMRVFQAVCDLRRDAYNVVYNGWINEYDLTWSTVNCANKHDL
jgi:hypothetical protein